MEHRGIKSRELPIRPPPRGVDLPDSDGEPMETERHFKQMWLLVESLKEGWKARPDFYIGGDMFMYFSELQAKNNDFRGPDVFVVVGVDPKERRSWVVWEENGRTPDVIVELLSESTEDVDRGEKMRIYSKVLKVPVYYLYDPFTEVFDGYELVLPDFDYRPMAKNEHGRIPCGPLGLELGIWRGSFQGVDIRWLRWFTPSGEPIMTAAEQAVLKEQAAVRWAEEAERRAGEATRRADEEARRADELAERVAELEARLGKIDK